MVDELILIAFSSSHILFTFNSEKVGYGDFPGAPVVGTSPSSAGDTGRISDQGAKIPHASWPKDQSRSNTVRNSIKAENGSR